MLPSTVMLPATSPDASVTLNEDGVTLAGSMAALKLTVMGESGGMLTSPACGIWCLTPFVNLFPACGFFQSGFLT